MYFIVGDYVRIGNTTSDPLHSMVVRRNERGIISINRVGRKLFLHTWINHPENGVEPLLSTELNEIKKDFLENE